MNWSEFRHWCYDTYRFQVKQTYGRTTVWAVVNQTPEVSRWYARNGKGSGHEAVYGLREQHRFAVWLRLRDLVDGVVMNGWLTASESHTSGWLVNDGSGIRWVAEPEKEAHQLVARGFVAVRCGL